MTSTILAAIVAFGALGKPEPFATQFYPYRGDVFTSFVADSYKVYDRPNPASFYSWFEDAAQKHGMDQGLLPTLESYKKKIHGAKSNEVKAKLEKELGAEIHKTVKAAIPKFSLDRGYDFVNTVERGERQCFLQSVLVSGLLQKAGVDSGVAMVWKNLSHQEINNGHAVAVERLSDGNDIIVDCSDPTPFVKHEGLFLRDGRGGYRFLDLAFKGEEPDITGYRAKDTGAKIHPKGLDIAFLRSQFDYYRGERAPGGFYVPPRTPEGLQASAKFLEKAVKECPENPLAVYVLGHVYRMQHRTDLAKRQYEEGYAVYKKEGWIPDGPREAYASAK